MADLTDRWQQIVRTIGATHVVGHHAVEVPDLGTDPANPTTRPGIRLFCQPFEPWYPGYTIDVTATATLAMLEGFLASGQHVGKRIGWSARGYGVRRRDTIHIKPM